MREFWGTRACENRVFRIDSAALGIWGSGRISFRQGLQHEAGWFLTPLVLPLPPTRRVRDAVGPSPAAARVERCVYITNPLMVRPNGSPASAIARQRGFQLPLLIKMFSNQSCGNKHMDMLNLLLG